MDLTHIIWGGGKKKKIWAHNPHFDFNGLKGLVAMDTDAQTDISE